MVVMSGSEQHKGGWPRQKSNPWSRPYQQDAHTCWVQQHGIADGERQGSSKDLLVCTSQNWSQ